MRHSRANNRLARFLLLRSLLRLTLWRLAALGAVVFVLALLWVLSPIAERPETKTPGLDSLMVLMESSLEGLVYFEIGLPARGTANCVISTEEPKGGPISRPRMGEYVASSTERNETNDWIQRMLGLATRTHTSQGSNAELSCREATMQERRSRLSSGVSRPPS